MPFSLADAIFWIAVACCAVAQIAILRSVVISPSRAANDGAPASPVRRAMEVAWAILPGIALALVMVWTWRTMHATSSLGAGVASLLR